jgi:hypothetical protein
MSNPSLPVCCSSLYASNLIRAPEAYIDNLYVGKNRKETIDVYIENRLRNLTNLEMAVESKVQSMQQAFATQLQTAMQNANQSVQHDQSVQYLQETIQQLEQRIQQLEYRPVALQGPEGKPGIPGPQGPPGKAGPRGLRGPAGGVKKLSELEDVDLKKLKDGAVLSYSESKDTWSPVLFDSE